MVDSLELVKDGSFVLTLKQIEKQAISTALEVYPDRKEAARKLGIGRSTLYRKIHEYGLCEDLERAKRRKSMMARIAAEREQHEAAGTLLIAA